MKWLKDLFGVKEETREYLMRPRYGKQGEMTKAIREYVIKTSGPFTIRDVAKGIGHYDKLGRGLHKAVHPLEKEGLVKMLPREKGKLMLWEKVVKNTPAKPQTQTAKPHHYPKGTGGRMESVLDVITTAGRPLSLNEIRDALGLPRTKVNDTVYGAVSRLCVSGAIRKVGSMKQKGHPYLFDIAKPSPKPTLTSSPLTVPFYYDAEFRVVAKRDKRLMAVIEQKRADSLGKEKWEPAETNVRLYQQALKAVCGQLLGGVM